MMEFILKSVINVGIVKKNLYFFIIIYIYYLISITNFTVQLVINE